MNFLSLLLVQEGARTAEAPNPMGIHTWFIILAAGSFLAWSISYSLLTHKEALSRKLGREELTRRREQLLDRIAELELSLEGGTVSEHRHKQELSSLKYRLAKLIEKLGPHRPAEGRPPTKKV